MMEIRGATEEGCGRGGMEGENRWGKCRREEPRVYTRMHEYGSRRVEEVREGEAEAEGTEGSEGNGL